MIKLTIDGEAVEVPEGTRLIDAIRSSGRDVSTLCDAPGLRPVGMCRVCVVDVGERALAASCVRLCESGMEVATSSQAVLGHRRQLIDLLMADQPPPEGTEDPLARPAPMAMCSYPVVNLVSESSETSKFKGQVGC